MTVRVIVVDDSPTMRGLISALLKRDPEIDVIATAADTTEARALIKQFNPDVITLDVEMPGMNGLEFLEKIMRLRPMPVVMVSTLTQAGADATLSALDLGAVDCVGKPMVGVSENGFSDLASKVKVAAGARVRSRNADQVRAVRTGFAGNGHILAIGSSTGGVEALGTILSTFPANCPPTVVTQHMPPMFTRSFADRLNRICKPSVSEANHGDPIEPGRIYIAPGGTRHLRIAGKGAARCELVDAPPRNGHCPSVDVLFESVAQVAGKRAVGVILTGMGRDGASGLLQMRESGASTIGQDEGTSVVYGMPKVAFEIGAVERQVSLGRIADAILDECATSARKVG
jgi:two-component system chemotaxis response regulator CheB